MHTAPPLPPPPPSASLTWSEHVVAWDRSGLTAGAYGAAHGIRPSTLYGWRRRARRSRPTRATAASHVPRLVPVTVEAPALCELVLRDGRVLRFPASIETAALASVLDVVRAR